MPDAEAPVRRFFETLNAADWPGLLALLGEDVALDDAAGNRSIGRDAFREALAPQALAGEAGVSDLVVLSSGDGLHAAAEFTLRAGGTSRPAGLFFEIEDGLITRVSARAGLAPM